MCVPFAMGACGAIGCALAPFPVPMLVAALPILAAAYVGGLRGGIAATLAAVSVALLLGSPPKASIAFQHPIFSLAFVGLGSTALLETLREARRRGARHLERVASAEQRLGEIAEAIEEVVWIADATLQQFHYASPAFERVWGQPPCRLYDSAAIWWDAIDPEDRPRVQAHVRGEHAAQELEYRVHHPDGTVRLISHRASPVRDASGQIVRIAGVALDVTEHKHLQEQLLQTQKMESLGLLASMPWPGCCAWCSTGRRPPGLIC